MGRRARRKGLAPATARTGRRIPTRRSQAELDRIEQDPDGLSPIAAQTWTALEGMYREALEQQAREHRRTERRAAKVAARLKPGSRRARLERQAVGAGHYARLLEDLAARCHPTARLGESIARRRFAELWRKGDATDTAQAVHDRFERRLKEMGGAGDAPEDYAA